MIFRDSGSSQPHSGIPNVMAPRQTSETRSPERPRVRMRMAARIPEGVSPREPVLRGLRAGDPLLSLSARMPRPIDPASLPKHFDAGAAEPRWDAAWAESGVYAWDPRRGRDENFVVDTPPPTVSGSLHVGHVFSYTH